MDENLKALRSARLPENKTQPLFRCVLGNTYDPYLGSLDIIERQVA